MRSFAEVYPELANEWSEKNELGPDNVSYGSSKKYFWKGKCGHEWEATAKNRGYRKSGCPYCSGNKVLKGFNDLATIKPKLVKEWSEKNRLKPTEVTSRAETAVLWKCRKCGFEWKARIADRTVGSGCPVCAGHVTAGGINDLQTLYPELASDWSDKNELPPFSYSVKSRENVWWKCRRCGFEWQAVVYARTTGLRCPNCRRIEKKIREEEERKKYLIEHPDLLFRQKAVAFYAKRALADPVFNSDEQIGIETEIYLPKERAVIECGSEKALRGKQYRWENVKNWLCVKSGIRLFRIVPPGGTEFDNCICIMLNDDTAGVLDVALQVIFEMLEISTDIDVIRDHDMIIES